MPETPPSWEDRETDARRYNEILPETLRSRGFPESELWITCACSAEVFKSKMRGKHPKLLIPQNCHFIVFAETMDFVEYAGFNTEEEFEEACRILAETWRELKSRDDDIGEIVSRTREKF